MLPLMVLTKVAWEPYGDVGILIVTFQRAAAWAGLCALLRWGRPCSALRLPGPVVQTPTDSSIAWTH